MKTLTIKERVAALERLKKLERIRNIAVCDKLGKIEKQIRKDCPHKTIKTLQAYPESLDYCDDCGEVIF